MTPNPALPAAPVEAASPTLRQAAEAMFDACWRNLGALPDDVAEAADVLNNAIGAIDAMPTTTNHGTGSATSAALGSSVVGKVEAVVPSDEQIEAIAGRDELTGDAILEFARDLLRAFPPGVLVEPAGYRYRYGPDKEWLLAYTPSAQWAADHPGFEEEPLYAAPAVPVGGIKEPGQQELELLKDARDTLCQLSGQAYVAELIDKIDAHLTARHGKFPDSAGEGSGKGGA